MTDHPGGPRPDDVEQQARRRRVRALRAVGLLVLVALVAVFVVQNYQHVTVRFWIESSHPRLIWVVLGCLVVGMVLGYMLRSPKRRAARQKRRQERKHREVGQSGL